MTEMRNLNESKYICIKCGKSLGKSYLVINGKFYHIDCRMEEDDADEKI